MLSTILAIATAVIIVATIAYFILTYLPDVINFCNSIFDAFASFSDLVPDWLLAFALVPLLLFIIGIIIKLL